MRPKPGPIAIAIPARDEEDRIGACLEALGRQEFCRFDDIVVYVNNSADNTAKLARATNLHRGTRLHVIEVNLPAEQANAGFARRAAMAKAAAMVGPDGILLTTDADGLVDPDWLYANLIALRDGADAVAGWAELHPLDWGSISTQMHEDDARECAYDALCDEIHAQFDPDDFDPLPRHTQHSGASIAVTARAFAACGGVPAVPSGEDRALIAALRRIDARIRHAPEVHVTVSGRIVGRAVGGMADTIRRRMSAPDLCLDDRLEPAVDCARRAICRADLRNAYNDPDFDRAGLQERVGVCIDEIQTLLRLPYFGMAWEGLEAIAPGLVRHLVSVRDLPEQMASARAILLHAQVRDQRFFFEKKKQKTFGSLVFGNRLH